MTDYIVYSASDGALTSLSCFPFDYSTAEKYNIVSSPSVLGYSNIQFTGVFDGGTSFGAKFITMSEDIRYVAAAQGRGLVRLETAEFTSSWFKLGGMSVQRDDGGNYIANLTFKEGIQ